MKKFLSFFGILAVLLGVVVAFSITVSAKDSGSCGNRVKWTLSSDGVLTISGTGMMKDYNNNNFNITPWYNLRSSIEKVVIEDGVTSIGDFAFESCSKLTSITIPDSVSSIGHSAFAACYSLTSVTIPNRVTFIDGWTFYACVSLTSIIIPDSVERFAANWLRDCSANVTIYFLGSAARWKELHRTSSADSKVFCDLYYNSNGEIVSTLYAPDGSCKEVLATEIEKEKATGWWFEYPVQTVYHPNGECKNVPKSQVEQEVENGWYDTPEIYIYHPNGNSILVSVAEAYLLKNEGWYLTREITMYAPDGSYKEVAVTEIENEKSTEWWFEYPVTTMRHRDGRTEIAAIADAPYWEANGWYAREYANMYSMYGEVIEVPIIEIDTKIAEGWFLYPVTVVANNEGKLEIAPTSDLLFWEKEGYYSDIKVYADSGTVGEVLTKTISALELPFFREHGWFVQAELVTMHCIYNGEHYTFNVPYTIVSNYQSAGWRTYAPKKEVDSIEYKCSTCGGTGREPFKSRPPKGSSESYFATEQQRRYDTWLKNRERYGCTECYGKGYTTEYYSYYTY